jgi:hypothetical protein
MSGLYLEAFRGRKFSPNIANESFDNATHEPRRNRCGHGVVLDSIIGLFLSQRLYLPESESRSVVRTTA